MPTPPKKRRRAKEERPGVRKKSPNPIVGKEFNYVLQLTAEDAQLLHRYQDVLALAPFGKIPVLKSAVDGWKDSSEYFANYDPETLEQIANGYDSMQRWLFRPDYDSTERAVVGDIEGRLLIPQVVSGIALEGSMTPETGAAFLQEQVEALLAERSQ